MNHTLIGVVGGIGLVAGFVATIIAIIMHVIRSQKNAPRGPSIEGGTNPHAVNEAVSLSTAANMNTSYTVPPPPFRDSAPSPLVSTFVPPVDSASTVPGHTATSAPVHTPDCGSSHAAHVPSCDGGHVGGHG